MRPVFSITCRSSSAHGRLGAAACRQAFTWLMAAPSSVEGRQARGPLYSMNDARSVTLAGLLAPLAARSGSAACTRLRRAPAATASATGPPSAARREIVSSRALAPLGPAASRDGYRRHLPGVLHRHGFSGVTRITGTRLAARNRLADFRLRGELAVLYGVRRQTPSPRGCARAGGGFAEPSLRSRRDPRLAITGHWPHVARMRENGGVTIYDLATEGPRVRPVALEPGHAPLYDAPKKIVLEPR
jgi:hypothetical protein